MSESTATIRVEVAYALPDKQKIITLDVEAGSTARAVVIRSGIAGIFEGLVPETARLGVFGKALPDADSYEVQNGDRIEIYRPLKADPKEVRKQRAQKTR